MLSLSSMRIAVIALAIAPGSMIVTSAPAFAQIDVTGDVSADVGVDISADVAPPPLPTYSQPPCPGDGYLWTPGYWGYNAGYYWVPGVWVQPPVVGVLWTPPYWGFAGGLYGFHRGYWGPQVGFYGGINYGYGFGGIGFVGGYWQGGAFQYNRAYANVSETIVHNTYIRNVAVTNNYGPSYNGPGGFDARPTPEQIAAAGQRRYDATAGQQQGETAARENRGQYARENGGHPETPALSTNRSGFGDGNEVNTRQGNQQSRIDHGVEGGGITPGEERNLENRDNSIHSEAQSEREANGGSLTPQEREQINQRQNNVSRSIYNDRHNANNDAAAGARNGYSANQERRAAQRIHRQQRPRGPYAHPQRP